MRNTHVAKEPQGPCLAYVLTSNKQTKQLVKQQTKCLQDGHYVKPNRSQFVGFLFSEAIISRRISRPEVWTTNGQLSWKFKKNDQTVRPMAFLLHVIKTCALLCVCLVARAAQQRHVTIPPAF